MTIIPPRPKASDDNVMPVTARKFLEECKMEVTDANIATVIRAVRFNDTVFAIGKTLDSAGWDIDDDMLERIDGLTWLGNESLTEALSEWVRTYQITPKLAAGAAVFVKRTEYSVRGCIAEDADRLPATIVSVDELRATYTVNVQALGHKRPFSDDFECGTVGIVLPFEQFHELREGVYAAQSWAEYAECLDRGRPWPARLPNTAAPAQP